MSDLRHALRGLAGRPGWTATIVLTLALAIAADTTLFTYLSAAVWPTIDAPSPERVVYLFSGTDEDPDDLPSYPDWRDYRERSGVFERFAASRLFAASVVDGGTSAFAWGTLVTGDYFPLFDQRPLLGRWLAPEDDRPGAPPVMVLGEPFWRRTFGADPGIVGRTVSLDGRRAYTVVGVTPPGFQADGLPFSIYLPMSRWRDVVAGLDGRDGGRVTPIGRLRRGVSRQAAEQALAGIARGLDETAPVGHPRRVSLRPATSLEARAGEGASDPLVRRAVILAAIVGLLLLLAAANVANLFLARLLARRRELGVRAALGASRWRLVREIALESLLLALAGGAVGAGLARLATAWLEPILHDANPVGFGSWGEGSRVLVFDGRMLAFALGLAVATALLVSLAPVLEIARGGPLAALRSGSERGRPPRGPLGLAGGSRRLLVVVQVALALVLLVVAGLLLRSLGSIDRVDPGFDLRGLFLASLYLPEDAGDAGAPKGGSPAPERQVELYAELAARLASLPEVRAAGLVARPPLFGGSYPDRLTLDGGSAGSEPFPANGDMVGPGYFETLGLPILRGRAFTAADRAAAPGVAVVNQTFVRHHLAGADPIGHRVTLGPEAPPRDRGRSFEIVGVVADSRYGSLMDPPGSMVYYPAAQRPRKRMTVVLRAAGAGAGLGETVRRLLHREHPEVAVVELVPFTAQIRRSLFEQRLQVRIASAAGVLGLLLASVGLAAVVAYSVRRRRREIAVRMALGARLGDAVGLVLRDSLAMVVLGLVLGLAAALALGKLLESLLFGVSPWDPLTLAAGATLLAATALGASWPPARRAARVDPASVLKEE